MSNLARWGRQGRLDYWAAIIVWEIVRTGTHKPIAFPDSEIAKAVAKRVNKSLKLIQATAKEK